MGKRCVCLLENRKEKKSIKKNKRKVNKKVWEEIRKKWVVIFFLNNNNINIYNIIINKFVCRINRIDIKLIK